MSGETWSASLTPSAAGTFYLWAEQTGNSAVQAVSPAITVVSVGGSPLTFSLIGGSGDGSMSSVTATNGTGTLPIDFTSIIVHGSADVRPSLKLSSIAGIGSGIFWFDTSATSTTIPSSNYGYIASFNNNEATLYQNNSDLGTPAACPAAPAAPGTYYAKFAFYSGGTVGGATGGTLMGIFVSSAITVT